MKPVIELKPAELFDRLSLAVYYGMATRTVLYQSPRALKAAQDLVDELRQDEFLREQIER
jgi:hypothetical protein